MGIYAYKRPKVPDGKIGLQEKHRRTSRALHKFPECFFLRFPGRVPDVFPVPRGHEENPRFSGTRPVAQSVADHRLMPPRIGRFLRFHRHEHHYGTFGGFVHTTPTYIDRQNLGKH